mmetsp:Transcript_37854/g.97933  ORF Transcript_37854/g.97933 Transcript_37854/m.97933 type:complete len:375 (-) Transcript_37854:110-1234(-)
MHLAGPPKTGAFKGFGFGAKPAGPSKAAGARPAGLSLPARKPTAKAAAAGGVTGLFKESLDGEEDDGSRKQKNGLPAWAKPSEKALHAQKMAESLQAEDPSVFQYDEVIDDIREEAGLQSSSQSVRADALTQKKRVGLTVPKGAENVATGSQRQAKYIEKVMLATDRRKVEQQIIEDRLLKKEKDARKDCEVFVTEAFKEELKKRKRFEEEMERQDTRDSILAAEKQENGAGFADMYRNLLNGGLASGRGGEKVKEIKAAKADLDEVKEEDPFAADPLKKEVKEEVGASSSGHGVVDVKAEVKAEAAPEPWEAEDAEAAAPKKARAEPPAPPPKTAEEKAAEAAEEKSQREGKAMSAKERYLARKKAAAAAGEA